MKFLTKFIFIFTFLISYNLQGQKALLTPTTLVYSELSRDVPEYICPAFDVEQMKVEDEETNKLGSMPERFAKKFDVALNVNNSGKWEQINDLSIWRLSIKSEGAYSMMITLRDLYLPDNSSIFIYNIDMTHKYGPYTSTYMNKDKILPLPLVRGDNLIIELVHKNSDEKKPFLEIESIAHDYRDFLGNFNQDDLIGGAILECHNDVNCPIGANWQTEKQAIARIIIELPNNDIGRCSGSLINNTEVSRPIPFFLLHIV